SACGTAVHTTLRPGQAYTSLEIKVNFLRAMTAETGRVTVRGWVVRPGSKAAYAEADIRDADGRILASASSTCAVFEAQQLTLGVVELFDYPEHCSLNSV